jgi:hypothetical protein
MARHRDDLFKRAAVLEINGTAGIGATLLLPALRAKVFFTTLLGRSRGLPRRSVEGAIAETASRA